ncbi:MAG: ABC-F family ATP-binding cassette domain-containing protein [Polyangiales bacterium]
MSLLALHEASLTLGGKSIFENLVFQIADGDRIGLIGANGSGKTTLLRVICGEQTPDTGQLVSRHSMRLGYLPQDVQLSTDQPLIDFIIQSVPGRSQLDDALIEAEAALQVAIAAEHTDDTMEWATVVAELHEQLAHFDQHYSEHEAKSIVSGLGFKDSDHGRSLSEFSGGWKMRAVLASLLYQRPDLLLLDEPTNHLDMPSVAWLSGFLKRYKSAFILICHDREFLNEQVDRIVSFEQEGIRSYRGDYEQYLRQRAEEETLLLNRAKNIEKEREHLEQFIRRFRAKASKAAQVQSRVKALEKLQDVQLFQPKQVMHFRFPPCDRAGKEILKVDELSKSYGDHKVLEKVDLRVERGDRVALIGVNGAGKTTLFRILAGEIEASEGTHRFGHKTKVGYYAQHHADKLDPSMTVYQSVASCAKDAGQTQIRTVLGAMLFGDGEIDKLVGVLSGGERARVALAQLMMDPGNVLLMDEPTNHLDLQSSEQLTGALASYDGTLLFVSHNRAFVRALA